MLFLPILLFFSVSSSSTAAGTSSPRLRGTTCFKRITQTVTFLQPVRFTQLVRTRKCHFLIFCKTAYRTRERFRMERRTKITSKMVVECCKGYYAQNGICITDPTHNPHSVTTQRDSSLLSTDFSPSSPHEFTSTVVFPRTISDDLGSGNEEYFRNTTESILTGKANELHITNSNQTSIVLAFIGCILSVFIIIVVIVMYKRRKKAAKYTGEIPYPPDVLSIPPKSKKDCSTLQNGLNSRNFPTTDENFYMSMDSNCAAAAIQVPSVKMMLATRGSGYRFSGLEDEARRPGDSLYVAPDPATYNNQNNTKADVERTSNTKFPKKGQPHTKAPTNIYINGRDIDIENKTQAEESDENIYSEIKAKGFKGTSTVGDENGYSFIRMTCVKEAAPEEEGEEEETSLYSSLNDSEKVSPKNKSAENHLDSEVTEKDGGERENYDDSLTRAKLRRGSSDRHGDINGETENRDDACDSGIYTSITLGSDNDDDVGSAIEAVYDEPKTKTDEGRSKKGIQQVGSDFYENCRRDSEESNYDIPRSHNNKKMMNQKDKNVEEETIYSDIASPSRTNTSSTTITNIS